MDKQKFLQEWYLEKGPQWCSEQLGISYRACVLRASRLGLSRRASKRKKIEAFVREHYQSKTASECARELGITEQRVRSVASELGVTGRREKTKYSKRVKADFFDVWTPESAYVLGFLYADGNLRRDRVSFYQVDLESKSERIRPIPLSKFRVALS